MVLSPELMIESLIPGEPTEPELVLFRTHLSLMSGLYGYLLSVCAVSGYLAKDYSSEKHKKGYRNQCVTG